MAKKKDNNIWDQMFTTITEILSHHKPNQNTKLSKSPNNWHTLSPQIKYFYLPVYDLV